MFCVPCLRFPRVYQWALASLLPLWPMGVCATLDCFLRSFETMSWFAESGICFHRKSCEADKSRTPKTALIMASVFVHPSLPENSLFHLTNLGGSDLHTEPGGCRPGHEASSVDSTWRGRQPMAIQMASGLIDQESTQTWKPAGFSAMSYDCESQC